MNSAVGRVLTPVARQAAAQSASMSSRRAVITKQYSPSPQLQAVIGSKSSVTASEAVKGFWDYAKANGLTSGRQIKCDANLKAVSSMAVLSFGDVTKSIFKNITPL